MGKDRWIARSMPGHVYCSPACGRGCKRSWYDKAVREASALAKRMGAGWEIEVWENLGWHWRVRKGVAEIRQDRHLGKITGYSAMLDTTPQIWATAKEPEDALGFATQDARGIAQRIGRDLAALME